MESPLLTSHLGAHCPVLEETPSLAPAWVLSSLSFPICKGQMGPLKGGDTEVTGPRGTGGGWWGGK